MNTLTINTGIQEYQLNEKCIVKFNPTDIEFVHKVYNVFATLDGKQHAYDDEVQKIGDNVDKMFEFAKTRDAEMRELIDSVFNVPVCNDLFDGINVFARADNGIPIWANLLFAIIDECDVVESETRMKASATIKKYTEKYHK